MKVDVMALNPNAPAFVPTIDPPNDQTPPPGLGFDSYNLEEPLNIASFEQLSCCFPDVDVDIVSAFVNASRGDLNVACENMVSSGFEFSPITLETKEDECEDCEDCDETVQPLDSMAMHLKMKIVQKEWSQVGEEDLWEVLDSLEERGISITLDALRKEIALRYGESQNPVHPTITSTQRLPLHNQRNRFRIRDAPHSEKVSLLWRHWNEINAKVSFPSSAPSQNLIIIIVNIFYLPPFFIFNVHFIFLFPLLLLIT